MSDVSISCHLTSSFLFFLDCVPLISFSLSLRICRSLARLLALCLDINIGKPRRKRLVYLKKIDTASFETIDEVFLFVSCALKSISKPFEDQLLLRHQTAERVTSRFFPSFYSNFFVNKLSKYLIKRAILVGSLCDWRNISSQMKLKGV